MKFKRVSMVLLVALVVTAMGVNLSAVEKTTSSIERFWSSIPDQYKTELKVYSEEGVFLYQVELVLANETTLSKQKMDMLKFALGVGEKQQKVKPAILLYYIHKPKVASGGWFNLDNLALSIPKLNTPYTMLLSHDDERGYLGKDPETSVSAEAPRTGAFIIITHADELREAREKGYKAFLYYKGGGPRAELKLPGEI